MIRLLEDNRAAVQALCRKYFVARLDVVGSAATGGFREEDSDLDFLVTFRSPPPESKMNPADQYFGLLFDLEDLFRRRIDLICAAAMRNPYFIRSINAQRQVLYAA